MGYGYLQKRVEVVISRLGRECDVHARTTGSADGFGNPSDSYSKSRSAQVFRTYPNRNSEVSGVAGDLQTDSPLFVFPKGEEPDAAERIEYPEDAENVDDATNTTTYEMQAPTPYDSHVEMFGEVVTNE